MKSYQAVKAEIAKLERRAEALRRRELKAVIAQIRKTMEQYGLSAADLGNAKGRPGRRAATRAVAAPKYRDPASGQTWSGRGRPPAWIAGAKDRDAFLIGAAPAAKARPARKGAAKAGSKAGAKRAKPAAKKRAARSAKASRVPAVQIESGSASE